MKYFPFLFALFLAACATDQQFEHQRYIETLKFNRDFYGPVFH